MKVNRDLLAELAHVHFESKGLKHQEAEKEKQYFIDYVLVGFVNHEGQEKAGRRFNVSHQVISKWLRQHHYILRPMWMKEATPEEKADIEAVAERVNAKRRAEGQPTLEEEKDQSA